MANQSGILGLEHTLKEKVLDPLAQYRGSDAVAGREATLSEFCAKQGLFDGEGEPLDFPAIFQEFNLNPTSLTLGHLLTLAGDVRYLAPEVIRDFIVRGVKTSARYTDLCMGTQNVNSMDVVSPWIDFEHPQHQAINEAETIPDSEYTWGTKTTKIRKTGIGLSWSDELILSVTFPILSRWMERVGLELNAKLYTNAVQTLFSGDQTDGSEAASIIGTSTGSTLTFADFITIWTRSNLIGYDWSSMITSETMSNYVLNIAEFKPTAGGLGNAAVTVDSRNRIVPNRIPHFISSAMGDNQILLFDPSQALLYCVFRPLLVESERIIRRQVQGSVVSIMSGFVTVQRLSRLVVDKSKAIGSYGFPTWMTPLV
jgi:hypothetical protein